MSRRRNVGVPVSNQYGSNFPDERHLPTETGLKTGAAFSSKR